jgi:hypothetical protein
MGWPGAIVSYGSAAAVPRRSSRSLISAVRLCKVFKSRIKV